MLRRADSVTCARCSGVIFVLVPEGLDPRCSCWPPMEFNGVDVGTFQCSNGMSNGIGLNVFLVAVEPPDPVEFFSEFPRRRCWNNNGISNGLECLDTARET